MLYDDVYTSNLLFCRCSYIQRTHLLMYQNMRVRICTSHARFSSVEQISPQATAEHNPNELTTSVYSNYSRLTVRALPPHCAFALPPRGEMVSIPPPHILFELRHRHCAALSVKYRFLLNQTGLPALQAFVTPIHDTPSARLRLSS